MMMVESSLINRIKRANVTNPESHKNLWYAEYLVTKRYYGLTQENKYRIGVFIGLTENLDKEGDINGLIDLRVKLARYINSR